MINILQGRPPCHLWAAAELLLCLSFFYAVIVMLQKDILTAFIVGSSSASAQGSPYWSGWHGRGNPWRWPGPYNDDGYWLDQTEQLLADMQNTYWNGTYWVKLFSRHVRNPS